MDAGNELNFLFEIDLFSRFALFARSFAGWVSNSALGNYAKMIISIALASRGEDAGSAL